MVTPATVLAVVRAGAPAFRCEAPLGGARAAPPGASPLTTRAPPVRAAAAAAAGRRGPEDAVVYAVHAALLGAGHALVGVGDDAKLEGAQAIG